MDVIYAAFGRDEHINCRLSWPRYTRVKTTAMSIEGVDGNGEGISERRRGGIERESRRVTAKRKSTEAKGWTR